MVNLALASQEGAALMCALLAEVVVLDEWALAEARLLLDLQAAGLTAPEAEYVIVSDDGTKNYREVNLK